MVLLVGILLFAEAHGCVELRSAVESYIHSNFLKVVVEEEYSDIPKEFLTKLLSSEHLRIDNEFQVYFQHNKTPIHSMVSHYSERRTNSCSACMEAPFSNGANSFVSTCVFAEKGPCRRLPRQLGRQPHN